MFKVLEDDEETTASGITLAIVGVLLSLLAAIAAGFIAKLTTKITSGVIGGIAGFFIGFLLYTLVFAQFVKSNTALLWITLIITTGLGAFCMYRYEEEAEVHVTHVIGSYLIVRGLGFFIGGYPNEAQTFFQLQKGNFNLPASFYGYLVGFIVLNVAGAWFQHKMGYHLETPTKKKSELNKINGGFVNPDMEHHGRH